MFSFALVRGQLSARAVCVAVGEIHGAGTGQGRCWKPGAGRRPFAGLSGVSAARIKGRERERKKRRVCTKLLDILLCASAGELYE